ncbi:SUN domain-containing protein 3 [Anolis sagrei]|uniref:SUN domain-containing protein 3 n=1 Tax=Anolis sagrei TaxID=38937 RepID=UPI003520F840
MYRGPRSSGNAYPKEDSTEANGSQSESLDSDTQHLLQSLSEGKISPRRCINRTFLSHNRENAQIPCLPKKGIIRLICNLTVLSVVAPFCLVYNIFTRGSCSQKIVFWVTLSLLVLGASYMELFGKHTLQLFGEKWNDFSICDLIQGKTEDLRSLMKANYLLGKKALELPTLKENVDNLQSQLQSLRLDMKDISHHAVRDVLKGYTSKGITKWSVEKMLKKIMEKMDEDYVQMPDYALKSAGASIVRSRTTRSYRHDKAKYFWKSFVILPFVKSPDVILEPNCYPGNCWPFPGNQGEIVVRLAREIILKAVTIEHISKKVSPTGEISSAPKDFVIYGLKEEEETEGTFLGHFVYDIEGDIIQTFQLKNELPNFMGYIKLNVLNNWGHPNYTCIYRFRVHGNVEDT